MIYQNNKIMLDISKFLLKIAAEWHLVLNFLLVSCTSFSSTFTEDTQSTLHFIHTRIDAPARRYIGTDNH